MWGRIVYLMQRQEQLDRRAGEIHAEIWNLLYSAREYLRRAQKLKAQRLKALKAAR